jgi:hypothetical protein
MNRSLQLCNPIAIAAGVIKNNTEEAIEYIKKEYPNSTYTEDDAFIYRNQKFDYFQSGIDAQGKGQYFLVDPEHSRDHWLFSYGNKEDRWNDYIKFGKYYENKPKKTLIQKIINYFFVGA